MGVELQQLRYIIAVAEAQSVTRASRDLFITQPALSLALQKLERQVGVPLLIRQPRGMSLTPAGEAFVGYARRAVEAVDDATVAARSIGRMAGETLRIGMLPDTFGDVPRAILDAFRAQHPHVAVSYHELSYITHTSDLVRGRVDVGFLWPPYDAPDLRFLILSHEPRVLGVSVATELADQDVVDLDDVLDLRFPGFHPESSGDWFSFWFFGHERGCAAATTVDEAATPFEMGLIVREGRAVAPAARSFALAFPAPGVRWIELTGVTPATLALAWHPENPNPAAQAFVRVAAVLLTPEACSAGLWPDLPQYDTKRPSSSPAPTNL